MPQVVDDTSIYETRAAEQAALAERERERNAAIREASEAARNAVAQTSQPTSPVPLAPVPVAERSEADPTETQPDAENAPAGLESRPTQSEATPENLSDWREAVLEAHRGVAEARSERDDAEDDVAAAKARLKHRQEEFEARVKELEDVILERGQAKLPLDAVGPLPEPELTLHMTDAATGEPYAAPVPAGDPGSDESWRSVPIGDLQTFGLNPNTVVTLIEEGVNTIGDLSGCNSLTDIKGIGEKKAEAIEDALERFWADRKTGRS